MKIKNIFNRKFIELTGCIHNHSQYSYDSKASLKNIIDSAKRNGLDFITINDHLTLKAKKDEFLLAEKDIQIIVGFEINDAEKNNHYLVFNSDEILLKKPAREYVDHYAKEGAIGFVAHPFEKRVSSKFRKYPWTDKSNNNFDGIEIWNFLSEWIGKVHPKLNGLIMIVFPSFFVIKPFKETLSYWDQLNNSGKKISAIGSIDAHEEEYKILGLKFKFLTHNALFKTIRTNILLPEKTEINDQNILQALKKGNSYMVNYKRGTPYNFYAGISNSKEESAIFGEEIKFQENLKFYYNLPSMARTKLIKNGKKIKSRFDNKGAFEIKEKGNYRLEITRFGRGWIYTNNIYVV